MYVKLYDAVVLKGNDRVGVTCTQRIGIALVIVSYASAFANRRLIAAVNPPTSLNRVSILLIISFYAIILSNIFLNIFLYCKQELLR